VRRLVLPAVLALCLTAACSGHVARSVPTLATTVPRFGHIVVIVMENKSEGDVIGSADAPNFNRLASRYGILAHYSGVSHPSLPNYLALISGSTQGISDDCTSCVVSGRSLADTLPAAGRTWKTYAEGLPRPGFTGASAGLYYAKKHVPFVYFRSVLTRPARLARVVPLKQLSRDLAAGRLPNFSLVVPNLCNDMHECSVEHGDVWLGRFLPPLLSNPQLQDGVVFVVFDEANSGNHVPAIALGPLVQPGSRFTRATSHYGLLRTIEDAWGLPRLGRSARATAITGIWR
jgi:phosphatidylinositol-3-phosphatase